MSWWAVGAAVASAVVKGYNEHKTAKKQDKAAAQSILKQAEYQREANQRMTEQLDTLEQSTPDDEFQTRSSQIRDQLRKKQTMALSGISTTGGGDAVTELAGEAGGTAVGYGDFINEALSGIDAPMLQRQGESFDRADVEGHLNRLRRNSAQEDNLLRLKQASIRPNPLLSLISTGLSAYSGARGFGGSTMAGSGTSTPVNPSIAASSSAQMPWNSAFQVPNKRGTGVGMYLGGP